MIKIHTTLRVSISVTLFYNISVDKIDVFFKRQKSFHQINNIRKMMKGLIEILWNCFIKLQVDSPVFLSNFFTILSQLIPK